MLGLGSRLIQYYQYPSCHQNFFGSNHLLHIQRRDVAVPSCAVPTFLCKFCSLILYRTLEEMLALHKFGGVGKETGMKLMNHYEKYAIFMMLSKQILMKRSIPQNQGKVFLVRFISSSKIEMLYCFMVLTIFLFRITSFEEGAILCNFLPLIREHLPSAAEEIESDIISLAQSEGL